MISTNNEELVKRIAKTGQAKPGIRRSYKNTGEAE